MKTYAEAADKLGTRERRKLANNTHLERRDAKMIAVRLHATDVLTYHADGRIVYSSGGWQTVTTKQRMNEYGPLAIFSDRGVWYASRAGMWSKKDRVPFADGLTVRGEKITHAGPPPKRMQRERDAVRKYADAFLAALDAGDVPALGAGDCFYCVMHTVDDGKPLGEAFGDRDHIESHLKENYFVPSLLANACKATGVAPVAWWYLGSFWDASAPEEQRATARRAAGDFGRGQVRKALIKYVRRQLGQAA